MPGCLTLWRITLRGTVPSVEVLSRRLGTAGRTFFEQTPVATRFCAQGGWDPEGCLQSPPLTSAAEGHVVVVDLPAGVLGELPVDDSQGVEVLVDNDVLYAKIHMIEGKSPINVAAFE